MDDDVRQALAEILEIVSQNIEHDKEFAEILLNFEARISNLEKQTLGEHHE